MRGSATLVLSVLAAVSLQAQMDGAHVETYKTVGGAQLNLYMFRPEPSLDGSPAPAIVFFFGGGWRSGTPTQFERQCRYLASRGMVAIAADYRVSSRNNTNAADSVRDGKSAIRWVRQNAGRLGIDPARIAAAGGSAGGHIAAAAGFIPGLDEPGEDTAASSRPDALVLFNPVLVLAPVAGSDVRAFANPELSGLDTAAFSPYHHVAPGAPPTIVFHGKADTTVPYAATELFVKRMEETGNRCDLVGFAGEVHGFFNYGVKGNGAYLETLRRTDAFLVSLGYLSAPRDRN